MFYIPDVSLLLFSLLGLRVSDISHSLASIWFSMEAERKRPLRGEGGRNSKQHQNTTKDSDCNLTRLSASIP